MVRFTDCFWDKDFNGSAGYETLTKRLKDGKKMCDDLVEFVRLRAKAEDDYGKSLIRLVQQTSVNEEIGSLKESWDVMKKETESVGGIHCDLARKLEEVERNMKAFREDQKNDRLKIDDRVKKLQKEKKSSFDTYIKTKRTYEQRCKEYDAAVEASETMSSYTPKEEEKLRTRKAKAKTAQENADAQYQSSVKMANGVRDLWEKEMLVVCEQFHVMEEERIKYLRNEMWVYANCGSQCNVDEDKLYENVRSILEKCDEERDIQHFIHSKQTGSERPSKVIYENYYYPSKQQQQPQQHRPQQQQSQQPRPQQQQTLQQRPQPLQPQQNRQQPQPPQYQATQCRPQQQFQRPSQQLPPEMQRSDPAKFLSLGRNTPSPRPSSASKSTPVSPPPDYGDDDPTYSSVRQCKPQVTVNQSRLSTEIVRAAYDYLPQGPEELLLKKGDQIEILKIENITWASGRNLRTRKEGAFPVAFVEKA